MAVPTRVAFDVSLSVVAAPSNNVGEQPFSVGDPVPWRELGLDESSLFAWWRCGLVRFEPAFIAGGSFAVTGGTEPVPFVATPGERVTVQTPAKPREQPRARR